jgi:hypothetical protein
LAPLSCVAAAPTICCAPDVVELAGAEVGKWHRLAVKADLHTIQQDVA